MPAQDRNNLIYVPIGAAMLRLEDSYSRFRDEIDGIYLQLKPATTDVAAAAVIVRGILTPSHRGADDYSLVVPAELLAEQRRTKRIFDIVMVALASISLLVGGIGIMNIMLASVLERTREIGVRRAVGARQADIVRQFLIETVMISFVGGHARPRARRRDVAPDRGLAGWSTIVTASSVAAGVPRVGRCRPGVRRLPGTARCPPRSDSRAPAIQIVRQRGAEMGGISPAHLSFFRAARYCLSKIRVFLTVWPLPLRPLCATASVLPSSETLKPLTSVCLSASLNVDLVERSLRRRSITTSPSGLLPVSLFSFRSKFPV